MIYILIGSILCFFTGYIVYGRYLCKIFQIDDKNITPAHQLRDNVDYVPAHSLILFGHHFSSIAGAGPIVGPIIAGLYFGWLPTLLWVVLGSIFIGGVHDFSAVVASIRHQGKSIPQVCKQYMNPASYRLFLAFIWLALVYLITVFADLTSGSFVEDGGVATASLIYMGVAVAFGYSVNRLGVKLWFATILAVLLMVGAIVLGQYTPLSLENISAQIGITHKQIWYLILMVYCFIASITPVWILLQPRDYISSYLLYLSVAAGVLGIMMGGFAIEYPHFLGWTSNEIGPMFPILFITVACGACSGFHSVVASGTTSKQLSRESDALKVGYGGMLTEGIVAVIALGTLAIIGKSSVPASADPMQIYSSGMGKFFQVLGLPFKIGQSFGYLAIATFILTTLDTATRLARYIVQDFFALDNTKKIRYTTTLCTLVLPVLFIFVTIQDKKLLGNIPGESLKTLEKASVDEAFIKIVQAQKVQISEKAVISCVKPKEQWTIQEQKRSYVIIKNGETLNLYQMITLPAWKAIWPVFGSTNQLLAALALLAVIVWLKTKKMSYSFIVLPTAFMMITTLCALITMILSGKSILIISIAVILCILAFMLLWQSFKIFFSKKTESVA